jgi:hypothetical protein
MLSELERGTVGCVPGLRKEDVEHQTALGGQTLGSQLEHRAQLVGRPKVGDHLGEQNSTLEERCERVTGFEPV